MAKNLVTLNLDNTDYSFRPYATCSTAATTAAKTVSITGFELCSGATILVRFTNSNIITNPTLNVNSTGAKPITCLGHRFDSNIYYEFVYNGSSWVQIGEEKYRCSLSSGNKNNFPWHRIAYSDVMTTAYNRRTIALILNQAVFGGKYGELVIKVATNATNNASSYEAYWVVNKGFGADDIKIGVNNTYGNTYFDVFYKCPGTWSNLLIEQKTGGYDSNFTKSFTLCSSQEVSDTTTTDRLTSYECYATIEAAATELHNTAYTTIISPNTSSGTLGKISFNGDLTGNAATATNANTLDGHDSVYFATAADYVKKAGDTMTGDLTLKTSTSGSPSIIFQRGETNDTFEDWKLTDASGYFKFQNRNSSGSWVDVLSLSPIGNKQLSSTYSLLPSTTNALDLGSSSLKWKNVFATTFTGSLSGNATSATTATTATTATNSNKLQNWTRTEIQSISNSNNYSIFDMTPLLIEGVNLGANCVVSTAPDNDSPFGKVWKCTGYTSWYSPSDKFLHVTPGETICIESWIMRPAGTTGVNGNFYVGLQFKDKNGNFINTNNGTVYMTNMTAWPCPTDGVWYRRYTEYTIPKTHTPYTNASTGVSSDGGAYYTGQIRLLLNYDKGTMTTYFGGLRIYKRPAVASTDELGTIKLGYTQSGKNYPVQLDSNKKAYVNVPWTDTTNADTLDGHDSTYFATKTEQDNLANQILALASGLSLTASVSPTIICKNEATSVSITATTKDSAGNVTASEIKILDGSTELKKATNTYTTNVSKSITTTNNTYTFKTTAVVNGMTLNKSISVNARYPIYYGMGTSATAVKTSGTKLVATSAIRTYSATAGSNGVRFYLLVPSSDVTKPVSFSMGGAPVNMASSTETLGGISYNVYYTNAVYNKNVTLTIEAKSS